MNNQFNNNDLKQRLTKEQYDTLINKGTEPPFSGKFLHNAEKGDYICPVCSKILFTSETKFDSGSGWPSFYDAAHNNAVKLVEDNSFGMQRSEVQCSNCGSHLGHLFHDGLEQPTGMRFCINSNSLNFIPMQKTVKLEALLI